jgi:hypothetical protein
LKEKHQFCKIKTSKMTAIELKKSLINRIAEIDDEAFLKAIKTILDTKAQPRFLSLTDEQRIEILASKNDIEQGLIIEQTELDIEFNKWLSAR